HDRARGAGGLRRYVRRQREDRRGVVARPRRSCRLSLGGPADDWLRLIAVAPGKDWDQVVGIVTGDASPTPAPLARDGFEIKLTRVAPKHWRARVRLARPGRWRLVLPNATHEGFMLPPPVTWMPWVQVQRSS